MAHGGTLPAGGDESEDDVVTRGQPSHAGTDFFHHAGTLVPTDDGQRTGEVTGDEMLVGVAHARCGQLDEHLTLTGRVELDRLDAPVRRVVSHKTAASVCMVSLRRGRLVCVVTYPATACHASFSTAASISPTPGAGTLVAP